MGNALSQDEILNLINQQKIAKQEKNINYQKKVALSVRAITVDERIWIREILRTEDSDSKLMEDERNWLKQISQDNDFNYDELVKLSPEYIRRRKFEREMNENRGVVRRKLDALRHNSKKYTPEELIGLRNNNVRKNRDVENFAGIYIIHNCVRDNYYVGKSEGVFGRAYRHFVTNPAKSKSRYKDTVEFNLPEIFDDYHSGDKFNISLISLEDTLFSTLDDLEVYTISAYNASVDNGGYNRTHGNVINKVFFNNDDQEKVANLILNKIKGTEIFSNLTNDEKRKKYIWTLVLELKLSHNTSFQRNFLKKIREYRKVNKNFYKN